MKVKPEKRLQKKVDYGRNKALKDKFNGIKDFVKITKIDRNSRLAAIRVWENGAFSGSGERIFASQGCEPAKRGRLVEGYLKGIVPMRLKLFALATLALIPLFPAVTNAEEEPIVSDSEKIDTLLVMQKQLVRTLKNDPLAGKNFGVEVNIARLLLAKEVLSFSGSFSMFGVDRDAEIAFPFYYAKTNTEDFDGGSGKSEFDYMEITQDIHYRYFLGNTQNGFYLSAFGRGAYLDGALGDYGYYPAGDPSGAVPAVQRDTEVKLGAGVGLGYRFFSYKGLYWGAGIVLGRYFLGESEKFRGALFAFDADEDGIIDVEMLKFGWAF